MSTPINQSEDLDAALEYAPPWARDRAQDRARDSARDWALDSAPDSVRERTSLVAVRLPSPVINPPTRARRKSAKLRPQFSGDRAMLDLQRQLALNPDIVPEPSPEGASVVWPILLRLCTVTALAAAVAWGLVTFPSVRKTTQTTRPEATTPSASLPEYSNARVRLARVEPPVIASQPADGLATVSAVPAIVATGTLDQAPPTIAAAAISGSTQSAIAATPSQAAPPEAAPPQQNDLPTLRLDETEIATLVKRGKNFLDNGDLASARLLLRRAADGGSPEGAFALAATYDPRVLQRLGAIGATPDPAKAREWYQRAVTLGSTTASRQLARLDADH